MSADPSTINVINLACKLTSANDTNYITFKTDPNHIETP